MLVTPPCSTFSRATWANENEPFPLRSRKFLTGFPWNARARQCKADFGTILADFSFEAMQRQFNDPKRVGTMEQPEDLGKTSFERIPGHSPASMWQFHQFETICSLPFVQTVAFSQMDFGTQSPKPTRFLMRFFIELHPGMQLGPPQFDQAGFYLGPLERRYGQSLIGSHKGSFRTSKSTAWPPALCELVANAIVASYKHVRVQRRRNNNFSDSNDSEAPPLKKPRVPQQPTPVEEEHEVNPMDPPFPGGMGKPRVCKWNNDGRWCRERRIFPEGRPWEELRAEILGLAVHQMGGLAEVEKEAFRMAKEVDFLAW